MPRRAAVQRNRLLKDDKIKLKEVLRSASLSSSSNTPEPYPGGGIRDLPCIYEDTPGASSSTQTASATPDEPTSAIPIDNLPENNPPPPPPYKVNIDETIIVLGLVRHWEILQVIKGMKVAPTSRRSSYNGFRDQTAQAMLEDAAPMTLGDATTLWKSILEQSALVWSRRGGLKKDYKRWTFKWWAMYKRGPPQLTVDARGSESDYKQRINSVEKRMQGIEASANHQFYIRSHGRVAECYFIHNPKFSTDAFAHECSRTNKEVDWQTKLARQGRTRHVYGPRVIDMSTENGKHLLNWIFGDIAGETLRQKLPKYWSIFCGSLAEQPAFEVVLKERSLTKAQQQRIDEAIAYKEYQERLKQALEESMASAAQPAAELAQQEQAVEPAIPTDHVEGDPTRVTDNDVDMDAQDGGEDRPFDIQVGDDVAAVEMAVSSPLTEKEEEEPAYVSIHYSHLDDESDDSDDDYTSYGRSFGRDHLGPDRVP